LERFLEKVTDIILNATFLKILCKTGALIEDIFSALKEQANIEVLFDSANTPLVLLDVLVARFIQKVLR